MKTIDLRERRRYMTALSQVVRHAGQKVLELIPRSPIADTHDIRGHESSTIDAEARQLVFNELERHLPELEGSLRFELNPIGRIPLEASEHHPPLTLIVDEIDGTTNAKRCFASALDYRPLSLISTALSTSDRLGDLIASVVFTLDSGEVFAAVRAEGEFFMSFVNQRLIEPADITERRGDSRDRIMVIGYSNSHRIQKGQLEQALYDRRMKVYEGCRASGMDIISVIRNGFDAYVDLRKFWTTKDGEGKEQEAMLQVYDVAGVLPLAVGCGLIVTDGLGNPWHSYGSADSISLVAAREEVHEKIIKTIRPLIDEWTKEAVASA